MTNKLTSDNRICRAKICFSPFLAKKLVESPESFAPERVKKELMRIQKLYDIVKADLLFFPICDGDHWFLICVNLLHKEINFFSSTSSPNDAARDTFITNVVSNFQRSCQVAEIFDRPLDGYAKNFPQCPQQCNNFDCGLYVMMYVEHVDGKVLMKFKNTDVSEFRKVISHRLIHHEKNEVQITAFDD